MDLLPPVSVRIVCVTLEAHGRHAGGFAVSADRSSIIRGLQFVRCARQLPIQRQDQIAQLETPPTLAPGHEYEAVTFVAPFLSMSTLIWIAGGSYKELIATSRWREAVDCWRTVVTRQASLTLSHIADWSRLALHETSFGEPQLAQVSR